MYSLELGVCDRETGKRVGMWTVYVDWSKREFLLNVPRSQRVPGAQGGLRETGRPLYAIMFLDLGMHPGPLLAYLMADPELSLQSMLMVAAVIGRAKVFGYVLLVALFSVTAGLLYGAWVDGVNPAGLVAGLAAFVVLLIAALSRLDLRQHAADNR